jgi:hypothetical protein
MDYSILDFYHVRVELFLWYVLFAMVPSSQPGIILQDKRFPVELANSSQC